MDTSMTSLQKKIFNLDYEYVWNELTNRIQEKNIPIFTIINHQKNAQDVSLEMPNTRVIIFGNPLVGTKLMLNTPNIALELPLKFLVRQEGTKTIILWHDPLQLAKQYHATEEGLIIAEKMSSLLQDIVNTVENK